MPVPIPAPVPPGLYVTSSDIIYGALRLINVLSSGETPSAAEGNDALEILNLMMDNWQGGQAQDICRDAASLLAN